MNDTKRMQNDEWLYLGYQWAANKRTWLRVHRDEIDKLISATVAGVRLSHTGPTGGYLT